MKRSTREARVLRARRETTEAVSVVRRMEAHGQGADLLSHYRADVARAAEAERTAADAPQKTQLAGFGRKPGKGEFRRG